jgi:hypothetical protein
MQVTTVTQDKESEVLGLGRGIIVIIGKQVVKQIIPRKTSFFGCSQAKARESSPV